MRIENKISWLDSALRTWAGLIWLTLGFSNAGFSQNPFVFEIIPGPSEGNSFSTIPFTGSDSIRFQQVYGAAGFTALGIPGPFLIRHLDFRLDTDVGGVLTGGFTTDFTAFQ